MGWWYWRGERGGGGEGIFLLTSAILEVIMRDDLLLLEPLSLWSPRRCSRSRLRVEEDMASLMTPPAQHRAVWCHPPVEEGEKKITPLVLATTHTSRSYCLVRPRTRRVTQTPHNVCLLLLGLMWGQKMTNQYSHTPKGSRMKWDGQQCQCEGAAYNNDGNTAKIAKMLKYNVQNCTTNKKSDQKNNNCSLMAHHHVVRVTRLYRSYLRVIQGMPPGAMRRKLQYNVREAFVVPQLQDKSTIDTLLQHGKCRCGCCTGNTTCTCHNAAPSSSP